MHGGRIMYCKWFMDQISAGRIPAQAEIEAHVRDCPICGPAFDGENPFADWSRPDEIKAALLDIIKILERTKGAFKSKDVELARKKLEALLGE